MLPDFLNSFWDEIGVNELRERMDFSCQQTQANSAVEHFPITDLPGLCCAAAGGDFTHAQALAAAWSAFYLAAHYLDDVADGQTTPEMIGRRTTQSTALIASASLILLDRLPVSPEIAHQIQRDFQLTAIKACAGQLADLGNQQPSLDACWRIAEAKTGLLYGLLCRSGARLAQANEMHIQKFNVFGVCLGVLMQIADDLSGLTSQPDIPSDIVLGKWTLPLAYAMQVASPLERTRLKESLAAARNDPTAEDEARRLLIQLGSVLYLSVEAERLRQQAKSALLQAAPPSQFRDQLIDLLFQTTPKILGLCELP